MDVSSFRRGQNYDELRPNYVIFICMFDPFNLNQPLYRFERYDVKNNLSLGDGQVTIFMNGVCSEAVPDELKSFYLYLQTGEMASDNDDAFVNKLDAAVQDAIQKEEVRYQMTLYDEMIISKEKLERVQAKEAQMQGKLAETKEKLERAQADADQAKAALERAQEREVQAKAEAAQMQGKLDAAEGKLDAAEKEAARIKKAVEKLVELGRNEDAAGVVISKAFRESIFSELGI